MNIRKILNSPIYITPNFPIAETKRYKLSLASLIALIILYTASLVLITVVLFTFTPMSNLLFFIENKELEAQKERIQEFESKIIFLSRELETIASENRKLQYAIVLANSDSLDSGSAIYDSMKVEKEKNLMIEGNILAVFNKLFRLENNDSAKSSLFFIAPSAGFIIKQFEPAKGHLGIDFGVRKGSPVYSSSGGLVIFSDYTAEDGNMIIIKHEKDFISVYKHCSALLKKERDKVIPGEIIALSGNSGSETTGPHLHFEIWKDGKAIDPQKLIINK